MRRLFHAARRLLRSQAGVTGVEYAVLLSMVCIAAIAGIRLLGINNANLMSNIANQLPDGQTGAASGQGGSTPGASSGSTPGKSGSAPGKK